MDIVFQFGDFSNSGNSFIDFIGTFFGIAIPTGVSLWIFFKEKKNQKVKEKEEYDKQIHDFTSYLVVLNKEIITQTDKQISAYLDFVNELNENPYQREGFTIYKHSNLKRVIKIDTKYLLEIFRVYNLDEKLYNNYLKTLDYIDAVIESILDDVYSRNGNGKVVTEYLNKFTQQRDKILFEIGEYLRKEKKNNLDYENDELYKIIRGIGMSFWTHEDKEIPDLIRDKKLIVDSIYNKLLNTKYKDFEVSNLLLNLAQQAGDYSVTVKQVNQKFVKDIEMVIPDIKQGLNRIVKLNELLETKLNSN